jgi:acyl-CoA reductase-like NAD-dependent aldehyde dehydrogenase
VWGALANAGQNCGAIERVYVEERVASRFLDLVVAEVDRLRVGPARTDGVDMGPLADEKARARVHEQVTEAVGGGAKLLRGGVLPDGPGFFYPPTVLMGPPSDCSLMRDETLGPVIPITVVESVERAILLANDNDYALTASGWTRSAELAERMMVGLQAGVVTINDVLYSFGEPAATWSGYRSSGTGQNHGTPGLREMSRQRFVSFDPCELDSSFHAYPYDDESAAVTRASLAFLHGAAWLDRLRALWRLGRLKRFRSRVPLKSLLSPRRRQVR